MSQNYTELLPYCKTATQLSCIEALIEHGTIRKAAEALGKKSHNSVTQALRLVRSQAALQGFSPDHGMTHTAPEGFNVKGVSTLYNRDGEQVAQWVKTNADLEARNAMIMDAVQGSLSEFEGLSKPVAKARTHKKDLMAVYPMGDPHIGMYAWSEETGIDFDTTIASRELRAAVNNLVDRSPDSETGLLLNLGDFFHADGLDNQTRQSKNVLDVDTRWPKVLRVGIDLMVECVYAALRKHKTVIVRNMIGNHDDHSSIFLSIALDKYFRNNKRVTIDQSPAHFWYHRFGKVLIGSTHGNTAKPDKLPGIMATDKAADWGETLYRYWYTGHIHNRNSMEFPGVTWESFRTLAGRDAWHSSMGYRAGRDMQCIIHHKEYGEVGRNTVNVDMIR